jgi:D-hexose-6-phosphate mutarotase
MPSGALIIELGTELVMSLMTMDVQRTMPFSAAMHTYFAVSNYETVAVTGLEECAFTEYADDAVPHCEDPLIPAGHIDRIYHPVPEEQLVTIHDPAWERSINIFRAGSGSTVVWNPGKELAATMGDLGAEASSGFLAVETTAVPAENLMLRCGETHRLTTRIQVISIR